MIRLFFISIVRYIFLVELINVSRLGGKMNLYDNWKGESKIIIIGRWSNYYFGKFKRREGRFMRNNEKLKKVIYVENSNFDICC